MDDLTLVFVVLKYNRNAARPQTQVYHEYFVHVIRLASNRNWLDSSINCRAAISKLEDASSSYSLFS